MAGGLGRLGGEVDYRVRPAAMPARGPYRQSRGQCRALQKLAAIQLLVGLVHWGQCIVTLPPRTGPLGVLGFQPTGPRKEFLEHLEYARAAVLSSCVKR